MPVCGAIDSWRQMAVASRRSAFTFWLAWVAAAAVGAALAATASFPTPAYESPGGLGVWISAPLLAAPAALLQFVVLRALLHASPGTAGLWFVVTLLAAALIAPATMVWYLGVIRILGGSSTFTGDGVSWSVDPRWADFAVAAPEYIAPVLLGIAQGVVLVRVFGRLGAVAIWLAANVVAFIVAGRLTGLALAQTYFEVRWPSGYVVTMTLFGALFGAVTGAALVALMRWRLAPAPIPVAA